LAYDRSKRKRVWRAIQNGRGQVIDEWTGVSRTAKVIVTAAVSRRRGYKITRIVNVYY